MGEKVRQKAEKLFRKLHDGGKDRARDSELVSDFTNGELIS